MHVVQDYISGWLQRHPTKKTKWTKPWSASKDSCRRFKKKLGELHTDKLKWFIEACTGFDWTAQKCCNCVGQTGNGQMPRKSMPISPNTILKITREERTRCVSFRDGRNKHCQEVRLVVYRVLRDPQMARLARTTDVRMLDALRLLNLPDKCPQVRIRLPPSRRPKLWDNIEDLVLPFGP